MSVPYLLLHNNIPVTKSHSRSAATNISRRLPDTIFRLLSAARNNRQQSRRERRIGILHTFVMTLSPVSIMRQPPKPSAVVCEKRLALSVGHCDDANSRHRPSMEDALVVHAYEGLPGLFVGVFDGHGGSLAAGLLRQQLHRHFLDDVLAQCDDGDMEVEQVETNSNCSTPPYDVSDNVPEQAWDEVGVDVGKAFERAYSRMDSVLKVRRCCRMGATAVTCFIRRVDGVGRVFTTANCGDARAVLSRGGRAVRLSVDHRPVDSAERRRVEEGGGFVTNGRVNGVLNVSRAFGDFSMKSVVVCTPAVSEVVLGNMDEFVVLACDGLWDFVDEQTVIDLAQIGFDRGLNAGEVAEELVREALERKSTDNISVMVVQFDMEDD